MYTTLATVSALAGLSIALPAEKAARFVPCTYETITPPPQFAIDFYYANGTGPVPLDFSAPLGNTPPTLYNAAGTTQSATFSYSVWAQLLHDAPKGAPFLNQALTPGQAVGFGPADGTGRGSIYIRRGSEGCPSTADVVLDSQGPVDASLPDPLAVWGLCQIPGIRFGQHRIEYLGSTGQGGNPGCEAGTLRVSAATPAVGPAGKYDVA